MNPHLNHPHQTFEEVTYQYITPTINKVHHLETHQVYVTNSSNYEQKKRLDYLEHLIDAELSETMPSSVISQINEIFEQKPTLVNNGENFQYHSFKPEIENDKLYSQVRGRKSSESPLQTPFLEFEDLNRPRVLSEESKLPKNILYGSEIRGYIDENEANREALKSAARGTIEDLSEAKEAVKELGHETKETVKNEAKEATKEIVGEENYAILSAVKGAVGEIKENVVNSVKAIQSAIKNEVIEVADSIVNVAEQNETELENSISGPKQEIEKGHFVDERSMSCNSRESIPHFSYVQKSQPYYQQNLLSPPHLNKSINTKIIIDPAHQNPVSPIVINNHLKKNGFVVPLSFILICTLVGIGFCLVFYQMIMD